MCAICVLRKERREGKREEQECLTNPHTPQDVGRDPGRQCGVLVL